MFHTKLDLDNGLWQCHTILHIDITRNHSKKDLINFLPVSKYKTKFDLWSFTIQNNHRKIQNFHFSSSKLHFVHSFETNNK